MFNVRGRSNVLELVVVVVVFADLVRASLLNLKFPSCVCECIQSINQLQIRVHLQMLCVVTERFFVLVLLQFRLLVACLAACLPTLSPLALLLLLIGCCGAQTLRRLCAPFESMQCNAKG